VLVTNGATLTLLDGVYNFDTLLMLNPDTSLHFSSGTIVNLNGSLLARQNVHVLPTTALSSARLPITTRGFIFFDSGNTVSADLLALSVIIMENDNVVTGNMLGVGISVNDRNRINVPLLPSLSALLTTSGTNLSKNTPPLDTLHSMEQYTMGALIHANAATTTRAQIASEFQKVRAVLER
jgi:hypothetical protein